MKLTRLFRIIISLFSIFLIVWAIDFLISCFGGGISIERSVSVGTYISKFKRQDCKRVIYTIDDNEGNVEYGKISKSLISDSNQTPKIALIVVYDKEFMDEDITKLSLENKEAYCKKHGYQFIPFDTPIDADRPTAWSKFPAVLKTLPNFDYLVRDLTLNIVLK